MNNNIYLEKFHKILADFDSQLLNTHHLFAEIGIYENAPFLKIFKKHWINDFSKTSETSTKLFFSIWLNEKSLEENKFFYNIHAIKMRNLKGYKVESRKFAEIFRNDFTNQIQSWENASINFGPLTLMQGWKKYNEENFEKTVEKFMQKFVELEPIIEKTLQNFKMN